MAVNGSNRFVAVIRNISRRKALEQQLLHDAMHDTLTGMANLRCFSHKVEQAIESLTAEGRQQFAVLYIDLDRFKIINDGMGHAVGDQFMIEIAKRMQDCLRGCDMAARLRDDEFAILVNRINGVEEAISVAQRLKDTISKPLHLNQFDFIPSAAIGIALSAPHYKTAADILRDADIAMCQAKISGSSSVELFNREMHQKAVQRLKLDSDLRQAIKRQEFQLYYQPIVSLKGQTLVGFEALVRWFHPKRGLVSPDVFIPMAEENGLIEELGEWVLEQAGYQLSQWNQLPCQRMPPAHEY